jgi:hypothetical protein
MPLLLATDLQDHLLVATNDLDRLQRLLGDATESLMGHFYGAAGEIERLLRQAARGSAVDDGQLHSAMGHLAGAITAMQFQDMAAQLIDHTNRRLRGCADLVARAALGDDDEDGPALVEAPPTRPNPVTQDEMDAGSVELF